MARYYVKFDQWESDYYSDDTTGARFDAAVVAMRDKARLILDPALTGNTWVVSDVIKWLNSNSTGYAFYIELRDGAGVPTGPQWLLIIGGRGPFAGVEAEPEEILGLGNDATISDYFYEPGGATTFGIDGSWLVHYNETGGTSTPYDGGLTWNADGSLTGGDLSAPTTSPYTGLATFMPSATDIQGACLNASTNGSQAALVMDDQKPFLAMYRTEGRALYIRHAALLGEIIDTYLGTDTFTAGTLIFTLDSDGSQSNVGNIAVCYDPTGTRSLEDIQYSTSFTEANRQFADGSYAWDILTIYSTFMKGYVDADIMKVIGGEELNYLDLFEQGGQIFFKAHDSFALPYVASVPLFPSE